ncbi:MAG: hypothetical protein CVU33_11700 [Betaproteobacteria bacterium HGW-Betaproteobacteria-6]|jgi:predicted RNase H-like nuclease (RuvC/YqgF family)|nr:MAG: hypothetical protein CVU33_11700 [Betaproteobacteria bacterium HGW-Betaproteobacteria-6]
MTDRATLKALRKLLALAALAGSLVGCAALDEKKDSPDDSAPMVDTTPDRTASDIRKIAELERQLIKEQRQCHAERRRLDLSLKESQKQNEELQKKFDDLQNKLDALLAIDRDLRSRRRNR